MSPAKDLLLAAAAALLLSVFEVSGDEVIPSNCDPSCQQHPPPSPPLSGYPVYGYPSPSPPSGYSIYDAPPPPHKKGDQSKCPPAGVGVQTPPFPYTYAPPFPYTYGPPNPYPYAPPNPYTYVPYGGGGRLLLPIVTTLVMIFSSLISLF